jgi:hypothetical protein
MKMLAAAFAFSLCPALAMAAAPGVRFDMALSQSGVAISSPSVWVAFGKKAVIEVPGKVRIVASANAPSGGHSLVQATFYRFVAGEWIKDWSPHMDADLSKTPSFERDIEGTPYRVVIKPRAAEQPSSASG